MTVTVETPRNGDRGAAAPMLRATGIAKRYGDVVALDGVDLQIARGEIVGLLGPNGAGKTTLVSVIAGLRKPDAGTVEIDGGAIDDDPIGARRKIGIAPQDLGIYLQLSVLKNLRFFGELSGLSGTRLGSLVEAVAAALDLEDALDRKAHDLSGGEQRRLHTAAAMLHEPPLLLLDEPTAGVDVHTRNRLLDVVRTLAERGSAICYTTHYLNEVESIAHSVTILDGGTVIASGETRELIARNARPVVELSFDGNVPPELASRGRVDGSSVLIESDEPGVEITRALSMIGDASGRIRSIEIIQPSLESVYMSITGRRLDTQAAEAAAAT